MSKTFEDVLRKAGIDPTDASTEAADVARVAVQEVQRMDARIVNLLEANSKLVLLNRELSSEMAKKDGRIEALLAALAKEKT